jgi:hypothetical protein
MSNVEGLTVLQGPAGLTLQDCLDGELPKRRRGPLADEAEFVAV